MLRRTCINCKLKSIPLGKELSQSLYRTTDWVGRNRLKSTMLALAVGAGLIAYDARYGHENRVPSPNISNHLEYGTYRSEEVAQRIQAQDVPAGGLAQPVSTKTAAMLRLEQEVANEADPFKRREMERVLKAETQAQEAASKATMVVTEGQLDAREPHWTTRSNERNWSIMARDQQKQKDSYNYRLDRSRDDDFGRNTQ